MSGKFSTALVLMTMSVSVSVFVVGTLAAHHATESSANVARKPASPIGLGHKEQMLGEFLRAPALRHTEKVHGPLSVKIELQSAEPEKVGDTFVLRGMISAQENVQNAEFNWSVPTGVELINGSISGTIDAVTADRPVYVELTLRKLQNKNVQVHLMASGLRGHTSFGDSAQFNTEIQKILDADRTATQQALEAGVDRAGADRDANDRAGEVRPGLRIMH